MKSEIKDKWIAALESGEYTQGKGNLRTGENYCVLGVLIDIAIKDGATDGDWHPMDPDGEFAGTYEFRTPQHIASGYYACFPTELRPWAGGIREHKVVEMNDNGQRFTTIANYIKENL